MIGAVRILLSATVLAVVALLVPMTAVPAAADPKLPEHYSFFAGIPYELAHPNGSLPGSNDFSCRPPREHPNPVVLVHGASGGRQTSWGAYVPMLKNSGFCVFALTYGAVPGAPWPVSAIGGVQPMDVGAAQLAGFVDQVLRATGAARVDIVGHSEGTMVPDYYAKYLGGAPKIHRYVSLAPLWRGSGGDVGAVMMTFARALGLNDTSTPGFNTGGKLLPGSDFLRRMWAGGSPYVPGIEYTNISTRYDEAVLPYTSGQVPGPAGTSVRNIVVQDSCAQDLSDHLAIVGSRRAAYLVHNALDPAHPWTVPCQLVPPFTG